MRYYTILFNAMPVLMPIFVGVFALFAKEPVWKKLSVLALFIFLTIIRFVVLDVSVKKIITICQIILFILLLVYYRNRGVLQKMYLETIYTKRISNNNKISIIQISYFSIFQSVPSGVSFRVMPISFRSLRILSAISQFFSCFKRIR